MNPGKNLINQKFGKLTVISKAPSILGGDTIKRYWGAWNCLCDCGTMKIVKTVDLIRGSVRSCGCLYDEYGKSYVPGQKINRLTTVSYEDGLWTCICECGNEITIPTGALSSGNTKSCGCLKIETSRAKSDKLIEARRKNPPRIASARRVWQGYGYRDKNMTISFDEFLKISQMNCFYCGIEPNTSYNYFSTTSSRGSEKSKQEGMFIYNGMDRIDSSKSHTIDNIVPCCILCNRAKNDRTQDEFLSWINNIKIQTFQPINIVEIHFPNGSLATSVNCVFYNHKNDTDMTVEEYYSLSQMNCFYCNNAPNNTFNRAKNDKKASVKAKETGNYIYNGIDRIDSNQSHNKNNIVPCCYYCNFAKNKLSLSEFHNWIKRIQEYQKQKSVDIISTL